ncbi:MAG: oligoribonuclease, partial [Idiomarina sp.]|nr:oligoribonuclease [Idiomarina sp.]
LKELAKRWRPEVVNSFKKSGAHEALADIRESVAELQHYRENFLRL